MNPTSKFLRGAALAILMGGVSVVAITSTPPLSFAADADDAIDTGEFSRAFRESYSEAVEAFQDDMDIPAAHAILAELRADEDLAPGERYTLEILDFQLYLQDGNYDGAAASFNTAYDLGIMPQADKENFLRIATIINQTDAARAVQYGSEAMNYPGWDDGGAQVLANGYYNTGDFANAQQFTQSFVDNKQATGGEIPAPILSILYLSQQELGMEEESAQTLGLIAVANPTPENWTAVTDYAFTSPNLDDRDFMNLYRLRRETGTLAAADYAGMVNLAVQLGLPAEGQTILDEGINGGHLSAAEMAGPAADVAALTTETEASLDSFATEAAAAATGQEQVVYGELLLGYERYADAAAAIQSGIAKGALQNPANAQILLGIALLKQGDNAGAIQAFQTAEQDSTLQRIAWAWRLYASI